MLGFAFSHLRELLYGDEEGREEGREGGREGGKEGRREGGEGTDQISCITSVHHRY